MLSEGILKSNIKTYILYFEKFIKGFPNIVMI